MDERLVETGVLEEDEVDELRREIEGEVLLPGSSGYEAARMIFNGMIERRPALIARCTSTEDVRACIEFARNYGLEISVKAGGHNVGGFALNDGGLVIDLSGMKQIIVDPDSRVAEAQAGLVWNEFDKATQEYGLAVTGGLVSTTGIAGFTLGGGIGWLMRKYGLTLDNLISAEVVTADGSILTASETENPDLFWGIRGGGGNFGVVTEFRYRLHPVSQVLGGIVVYPFEKAAEFLRLYREQMQNEPDELATMVAFVTIPPLPTIPAEEHGKKALALVGCWCGPIGQGEQVLKPLRSFGPPLADMFGPVPYAGLQSILDPLSPQGLQNYWKSDYLGELSDEVINLLVNHGGNMLSPLAHIDIHHMGGAYSRIPEESTAFAHRHEPYLINIVNMWENPAENEQHIRWTRELAQELQKFSRGVYVNFLGQEGEDRIRAAYTPEKYQRLVELKRKYDPENVFHMNQNIKP